MEGEEQGQFVYGLKVCPVSFAEKGMLMCVGADCEWWQAEAGMCCVRVIGIELNKCVQIFGTAMLIEKGGG